MPDRLRFCLLLHPIHFHSKRMECPAYQSTGHRSAADAVHWSDCLQLRLTSWLSTKQSRCFASIKCPVFRTKLTQERVDDLKHIHGVEAGEQSLVTFIVCGRMQHGIIHQAVVIAVQHFSHQEEIRFQTVTECPEFPDKILIQTVSHIQTQTVDIKFLHPASDAVKNMLFHIRMSADSVLPGHNCLPSPHTTARHCNWSFRQS